MFYLWLLIVRLAMWGAPGTLQLEVEWYLKCSWRVGKAVF